MVDQQSIKTGIDAGRFVFTISNFIMSVVFSLVLLTHAFTMEGIIQPQVFHADRVLQSYGNTPPAQIDTFIKQAYGADTEIHGIINKVTILQRFLPTMYEVSGSNSILRLEAIHCNFMLFSAMWIASAFALCVTQLPGFEPLYWGHFRVILVHTWNLLGLIFTIVIFSATTKWAGIPTSNLFYALVGQIMAWMYQYFHMVECTAIWSEKMQMQYRSSANYGDGRDPGRDSLHFSNELRKMIYMEFSIVCPMMLVSAIMPGGVGIDEWRVQTLLFSSWTLFALMGLHLRFRKSLSNDDVEPVAAETIDAADTRADEDNQAVMGVDNLDKQGLDALGYLTYAIMLVFMMLINAMGSTIFYDPPYATSRITQARWGARVIIIVAAILVLETLGTTLKVRFSPKWRVPGFPLIPTTFANQFMLPAFIGNMLLVGFGSFLVKILLFSGLSDVNHLSAWTS
jgi:hypothetical protein